jgi:hypothetical protein
VTLESDHSFVEMSHQMMETAWSWTNITLNIQESM